MSSGGGEAGVGRRRIGQVHVADQLRTRGCIRRWCPRAVDRGDPGTGGERGLHHGHAQRAEATGHDDMLVLQFHGRILQRWQWRNVIAGRAACTHRMQSPPMKLLLPLAALS